jgi:hypothetical protein
VVIHFLVLENGLEDSTRLIAASMNLLFWLNLDKFPEKGYFSKLGMVKSVFSLTVAMLSLVMSRMGENATMHDKGGPVCK